MPEIRPTFELPSCVNGWHYHHWGTQQTGIREFLTCGECSQERHYALARLAQHAFRVQMAQVRPKENPDAD